MAEIMDQLVLNVNILKLREQNGYADTTTDRGWYRRRDLALQPVALRASSCSSQALNFCTAGRPALWADVTML